MPWTVGLLSYEMKFAVHMKCLGIYAVWTLAYLILDELFEHILIIIVNV